MIVNSWIDDRRLIYPGDETVTEPNPDVPIACTLATKALAERIIEMERRLFRQSQGVERLPNGIRHRFPSSPETKQELFDFIVQETSCCAFLTFGLTFEPNHGPILLDITGPAEALPLIEETFGAANSDPACASTRL